MSEGNRLHPGDQAVFHCIDIVLPLCMKTYTNRSNRHTRLLVQVYELKGPDLKLSKEVERPSSFRCAAFGASSLADRHLATGNHKGALKCHSCPFAELFWRPLTSRVQLLLRNCMVPSGELISFCVMWQVIWICGIWSDCRSQSTARRQTAR